MMDNVQIKQTAGEQQQEVLKIRETIRFQKSELKNLNHNEEKLSQHFEIIKNDQTNLKTAYFNLNKSINNLNSQYEVVKEGLNKFTHEMNECKKREKENKQILKKLKQTVNGFIIELIPEGYYKENDIPIGSDEGMLVEVDTYKMAEKLSPYLTDVIQSGDEPPPIMQKEKVISYWDTKAGEHIVQKIKENNDTFYEEIIKRDEEILKIRDLYANLSEEMGNFKNKVENMHISHALQELQESTMNLSQNIMVLEGWHAESSQLINYTLQKQNQISQVEDATINTTNRLSDIEWKFKYQNKEAQQQQELTKNHITSLNTSVQSLMEQVKNISSKVAQRLSKKLEILLHQLHISKMKMNLLEMKVLNESLSSCKKANRDMHQDTKLLAMDRELGKLLNTLVSQKDMLKRLEYRINSVYLTHRKQTEVHEKMIEKTEAIYSYLPLLLEVQEEIMNFRFHLPKDCSQVFSVESETSGIYVIYPPGSSNSIRVLCDIDNEGVWTIIQRRFNGSENFNRSWDDYKKGFGKAEGEYWLGNEFIYLLTNEGNYSLQIKMMDISGKVWVAKYNTFRVSSEANKYTLLVSEYSGNSTDSLSYSNIMPFSTVDRDNDASSTHCAVHYTAGWWYKHCHYGNLNGRYDVGMVWFNHRINDWIQMQRSVMKIRPKS